MRKRVAADLFPEAKEVPQPVESEGPTNAEVIPINQLRGFGGRIFES